MEANGSSNSKLYLVAILLVVVFAVYIAYQKGLILKPKQEENTNNVETEQKKASKSLSADSRLVTFLYNEVTYDVNSCYGMWEYTGGAKNQNEFIADGGNEIIKMRLVGRLLADGNARDVDISKVPKKEDYFKVPPESTSETSHYYSFDYVQSIYKQLFGSGARVDKNVGIQMDVAGGMVYYLDTATKKYYPYYKIVGGECGPTNETTRIKKAEMKNNSILIYQSASWKEEGKSTDKYIYVYKFEQESDGLYKFVSRKVERE